MTLEDAIKHCEEIARTCNNEKCSIEHDQLKEWLVELKKYRNLFAIKKKEEKFNKIIEEKVVKIRENEEQIRNKKTEIAINEGYIGGIKMALRICEELENEEN